MYDLSDKLPENQGVEYFFRAFDEPQGSRLEYLLAGKNVHLKPQFESAKQDISSLVDMLLKSRPGDRSPISEVLERIERLMEKHSQNPPKRLFSERDDGHSDSSDDVDE